MKKVITSFVKIGTYSNFRNSDCEYPCVFLAKYVRTKFEQFKIHQLSLFHQSRAGAAPELSGDGCKDHKASGSKKSTNTKCTKFGNLSLNVPKSFIQDRCLVSIVGKFQ